MKKGLFNVLLISLLLLTGCGSRESANNSNSVKSAGYPIYELSATEMLPLSDCYDSYSVESQTYLAGVDADGHAAVSYTHLTLPTNSRV